MKRFILCALLVACTKPAGGPLKYTFDATRLASVPLDAKQPVAQAQQAHEQAQAQQTRASEDFHNSEIEVELAQFQAQNAIVVSALASATKPAAPTADTTVLARHSAEAKVAFVEARRAWLEKLTSSSLYAVYAAQAKLELERAKLAQANNLVPAGFDLASYQTQADERARAATTAAAESDQLRTLAETKLAAWTEAEKAFMKASGLPGPAESEHVAADWKAAAAAPTPAPPPEAPKPAPPAASPSAATTPPPAS